MSKLSLHDKLRIIQERWKNHWTIERLQWASKVTDKFTISRPVRIGFHTFLDHIVPGFDGTVVSYLNHKDIEFTPKDIKQLLKYEPLWELKLGEDPDALWNYIYERARNYKGEFF